MILRDLVLRSAELTPDAVAVQAPDTSITYRALDHLANRLAHKLRELDVGRGDRVGIWLEKSAISVALMQAALRLNAIYVPLDPLSPAARIRSIASDCAMRVLVTTHKRSEHILSEGALAVTCLWLDGEDGVRAGVHQLPAASLDVPEQAEDEINYILYTSGSTGQPKGVCISSRNALAFITWAATTLGATPVDRLANHAPFHFDLSVLDLYVAFHAGATVCLIPDGIAYLPQRLVRFLVQEGLTIWYSVPSALTLMMGAGGLLDLPDLTLRAILFAGEPFPIKHLRTLYQRWPRPRYLNLYGPTETNVCTYYEVSTRDGAQETPIPIGLACSGDTVWVRKDDGGRALPGEEGELIVEGPTVMVGYWGRPALQEARYATGDMVCLQEDGNYSYLGRRDHMVKVRGHRIELGAIEAALETHPAIQEVVVLVQGQDVDARLVAFLVVGEQGGLSLLEVKRHCAERLPRYMIVDDISLMEALPRTRNGKVDRLSLAQQLAHSTS